MCNDHSLGGSCLNIADSMNYTKRFMLVALAAAAISLCAIGCKRGSNNVPKPKGKQINLSVVISPDIARLWKKIRSEHLADLSLPNGLGIQIVTKVASGIEAARKISTGELKTHLWLAPSTSLVNLANSQLVNLGPKQIECEAIFSTPVVIAARPSSQSTLRANKRTISWRDLASTSQLASSTKLDSSSGMSSLYFNHPLPTHSVAGLTSFIQLAQLIAAPQDTPLTESIVESSSFERELRRIESYVTDYGTSSYQHLERLADSPENRLHFSFATEQLVATFNIAKAKISRSLLALYPTEGSHWLDYSICRSKADWYTAAHRAASAVLLEKLLSEQVQTLFMRGGFRPQNVKVKPQAPLLKTFGVDPSQLSKVFQPVSGKVLDKLLELWPNVRRPSAAVFLLDSSGSMEGQKLRRGKDLFRNLLALAGKNDLRALIKFASDSELAAPLSGDFKKTIEAVDGIQAAGGSAVYDALKRATQMLSTSE